MTEFDFVCKYVASVSGNGQANNINIECALQAYKQIRGLLKRDDYDPAIHGVPMEPSTPINGAPELKLKWCADCEAAFDESEGKVWEGILALNAWVCTECYEKRKTGNGKYSVPFGPVDDEGNKLTDDVPLIDGDSPIEVRNNAISDYEDYSGLISTGKIDVRNLNMNTVVKCLEHMIGLYSERRTDVADLCWEILEGKKPEELRDPEHRYINTSIDVNGTNVEIFYDTLTTMIEYNMTDPDEPSDWHHGDCSYRDEDLKDQIHPQDKKETK